MKTFLGVLLLALIAACAPTQSQLIEQAYDRGEITTQEYLTLKNQLEVQDQQNRAIMAGALLGYSANLQAQDAYERVNYSNQINQNLMQQQQMMQDQQFYNNLLMQQRGN